VTGGLTAEQLQHIAAVRTLDLRENKITSLPDEITCLASLERLDVTNNDLAGLPFSLGVLPHLKAVQLDGNPMKTIRRDIMARGTVGLLKYLRSRLEEGQVAELQKRGTGNVSPVPQPVASHAVPDKFTMKTSQSLSLAGQLAGLAELPVEAVEAALEVRVQTVDLSRNRLAAVPAGLEPLTPQLYELNLSNNKLVSLPAFLGTGRLLQFLNLANNQLTDLPAELGGLPHLREVALNMNQFSTIPEILYSCPKLETILVANNRISSLDVSQLGRLSQLAVLDLQNNAIQSVPPELGNLTQLRSLQLEGNTFRMPRPAVLVQGTGAVLAYLRDRIPK